MKFLVVHKILKNTLEIKCLQLPLNKFLCLETNLSKYFTCLPLHSHRQWSTKIECFSSQFIFGRSQMYSWFYLNLSYQLKKVSCSGKWITLFGFIWYLIVIFFVVRPSLLTKNVPSWFIYEETPFLFCNKPFLLCFSDWCEFPLGQWWHPVCACVRAVHLNTINNLFSSPVSGSSVPCVCLTLGTCWELEL